MTLKLLFFVFCFIGDRLAVMEHVGAERFVPCTDRENLRACLRTDGRSGFVFVNHYQRLTDLADVRGARISALEADFPPVDVCGGVGFFLPVHMEIGGAVIRWATAQPLCRQGKTFFFAAVEGISPQYEIALPDGGVKRVTVQPGLDSGFDAGDSRIVTLTWNQARYARRLDGELYIGDGVNLYMLQGELCAVEPGSFACWQYTENGFERMENERPFHPAQLTRTDVDEPFAPEHVYELELGGKRARRWQQLHVTSNEGFVTIGGAYDVAQIYADGELAADRFWTGIDWRVPASLLYGRECYLVMSEMKDDFYREA